MWENSTVETITGFNTNYQLIIKLYKMKKIFALLALLFIQFNISAQTSDSAIAQITETIMNYIDGTANGDPEKLRKVFHPDFNLYAVTDKDSLLIRSGEKYISNIKPGEKVNRIGRVISIDVENNAAIAKAEIVIPGWRIFTDYFLLMKYEGSWKIVQKSYTWRAYPKN